MKSGYERVSGGDVDTWQWVYWRSVVVVWMELRQTLPLIAVWSLLSLSTLCQPKYKVCTCVIVMIYCNIALHDCILSG